MAGAGDQQGREETAVGGPGAAGAAPPYPSRALRRARSSPRERPGAGRGPGWRCGAAVALAGEARAEAAAGCLVGSLGRARAQPAGRERVGMRRWVPGGWLLVRGAQQVRFAPEEADDWRER